MLNNPDYADLGIRPLKDELPPVDEVVDLILKEEDKEIKLFIFDNLD